jgi:hypothetical protein
LLLFLACLVVYNANLREVSSQDTMATRILPVIVLVEQRLVLDRFFQGSPVEQPLPYWVQRVGGHYLSSYPILPALLALPVYAVPVGLLGGDSWPLINLLAKISATLFAALSVLFVYGTATRLDRQATAVPVALVYAFGTSTWSISSQGLWGHGPAELFMAAALYAVLRGETRHGVLQGAGLATGLMVASRPATGVVAVALLGYVLHRHGRRGLQSLAAFGLVAVAVLSYNLWAFGSLQGGYAKLHLDQGLHHGVPGAWSASMVAGLAGLLLSPNRGLLVYSPVLVLALVGAVLSLRGDRRRLFGYLAGGFGVSLGILSSYAVWWGGLSFGPRLLTDFLPLLVLFLVPVLQRPVARTSPARVVFALLFALSVAVQAVGAFYYPSPREVDWNTTPRNIDFAPERLWDWRDTQVLRLIRNGPHPPGFGGVS